MRHACLRLPDPVIAACRRCKLLESGYGSRADLRYNVVMSKSCVPLLEISWSYRNVVHKVLMPVYDPAFE